MCAFLCVCVHVGMRCKRDYVGNSPPNDAVHVDVHSEVIVGDVPFGLHQALRNGLKRTTHKHSKVKLLDEYWKERQPVS